MIMVYAWHFVWKSYTYQLEEKHRRLWIVAGNQSVGTLSFDGIVSTIV